MVDPNTGLPMQTQNIPSAQQQYANQLTQQLQQNLANNQGIPMDQGFNTASTGPVQAPSNWGPQLSTNNTPALTQDTLNQYPSLQNAGSNMPTTTSPTTSDLGSGIRPGGGETGLTVPSNVPLKPTPSAFEQGINSITDWMGKHPYLTAAGVYGAANLLGLTKTVNPSLPAGQQITMAPVGATPNFTSSYTSTPNTNIYKSHYADGGITQAGPVAQMSQNNAMGNNQNFPGARNYSSAFANPNTMPIPQNVVTGSQDVNTDPYTGDIKMAGGGIVAFASGGSSAMSMGDTGVYKDVDPATQNLDPLSASLARLNKLGSNYGMTMGTPLPTQKVLGTLAYQPVNVQEQQAQQQAQQAAAQNTVQAAGGGIMQADRYNLGGYATGGNPRLLDGPGDGMSDNIPAVIANKQPARLADGEFVIPADVVSGLGNGSTKAGAKKLHNMMDKVRVARTGTKKQGKEINPDKYMPS